MDDFYTYAQNLIEKNKPALKKVYRSILGDSYSYLLKTKLSVVNNAEISGPSFVLAENDDNLCLIEVEGLDKVNISPEGTITSETNYLTTSCTLSLSPKKLEDIFREEGEKGIIRAWAHEYNHFAGYALASIPIQIPLAVLLNYIGDKGININDPKDVVLKLSDIPNGQNFIYAYTILSEMAELTTNPLDRLVLQKMDLPKKQESESQTSQFLNRLTTWEYINYLRNPLKIKSNSDFFNKYLTSFENLRIIKK